MASIQIRTAALQYSTGIVECHCVMQATTPLGPSEVVRVVSLNQTTDLGTPDWTDGDLCLAVATLIGVDVSEVAVMEPPAPL